MVLDEGICEYSEIFRYILILIIQNCFNSHFPSTDAPLPAALSCSSLRLKLTHCSVFKINQFPLSVEDSADYCSLLYFTVTASFSLTHLNLLFDTQQVHLTLHI